MATAGEIAKIFRSSKQTEDNKYTKEKKDKLEKMKKIKGDTKGASPDYKQHHSTDVRFSGDSRGHENIIPINLSAKEIAKKTIEENQLVFDRLANV